jgi:hypothetical protein
MKDDVSYKKNGIHMNDASTSLIYRFLETAIYPIKQDGWAEYFNPYSTYVSNEPIPFYTSLFTNKTVGWKR